MKLRKGKAKYRLPNIGQIIGVVLDRCNRHKTARELYQLSHVEGRSFEEMKRKAPDIRGIPICFTFSWDKKPAIEVYPLPDRSGDNLMIRYYPPAKEC